MDGPRTDLSFGARLRGFRAQAGLSQEALAERAGLGLATLKALERDQRSRPHPHTLALLADALGLAPPDRAVLLDSTRRARPAADARATRRRSRAAASLANVFRWARG